MEETLVESKDDIKTDIRKKMSDIFESLKKRKALVTFFIYVNKDNKNHLPKILDRYIKNIKFTEKISINKKNKYYLINIITDDTTMKEVQFDRTSLFHCATIHTDNIHIQRIKKEGTICDIMNKCLNKEHLESTIGNIGSYDDVVLVFSDFGCNVMGDYPSEMKQAFGQTEMKHNIIVTPFHNLLLDDDFTGITVISDHVGIIPIFAVSLKTFNNTLFSNIFSEDNILKIYPDRDKSVIATKSIYFTLSEYARRIFSSHPIERIKNESSTICYGDNILELYNCRIVLDRIIQEYFNKFWDNEKMKVNYICDCIDLGNVDYHKGQESIEKGDIYPILSYKNKEDEQKIFENFYEIINEKDYT